MQFSVSILSKARPYLVGSSIIRASAFYVEYCKSKGNIVKFYNSHSKMISIPDAALKSTTESIANEVPHT
jgi:hypothetical protein